MTFRIHFEWPDGIEDSFIVAADSLDDVRYQANSEVQKRDAREVWAEELKP